MDMKTASAAAEGDDPEGGGDLDAFLKAYGFPDAHGGDVAIVASGSTPLRFAAIEGNNPGVVRALLEKNVDLEAPLRGPPKGLPFTEDASVLLEAMKFATPEVIDLLLSAGCDPKIRTGKAGGLKDVMNYACAYGKLENVRFWLDRFPDYGLETVCGAGVGCVPLHMASQFGHVEVVLELLRRKASVGTLAGTGGTPLHSAVLSEQGDPRVLELLLDQKGDVNFQAAPLGPFGGFFRGTMEKVRQAGVVESGRSKRWFAFWIGASPLHCAAMNGLAEQVKMLLQHGADPNLRNEMGFTPAEVGARMGFRYALLPGPEEEAASRER